MPTKFQLGNLMTVHSEDRSINVTKIIKIDLKKLDAIFGTRLIQLRTETEADFVNKLVKLYKREIKMKICKQLISGFHIRTPTLRSSLCSKRDPHEQAVMLSGVFVGRVRPVFCNIFHRYFYCRSASLPQKHAFFICTFCIAFCECSEQCLAAK